MNDGLDDLIFSVLMLRVASDRWILSHKFVYLALVKIIVFEDILKGFAYLAVDGVIKLLALLLSFHDLTITLVLRRIGLLCGGALDGCLALVCFDRVLIIQLLLALLVIFLLRDEGVEPLESIDELS